MHINKMQFNCLLPTEHIQTDNNISVLLDCTWFGEFMKQFYIWWKSN